MKLFSPRNITRRQAAMPLILWCATVLLAAIGMPAGWLIVGNAGVSIAGILALTAFVGSVLTFGWHLLVDVT